MAVKGQTQSSQHASGIYHHSCHVDGPRDELRSHALPDGQSKRQLVSREFILVRSVRPSFRVQDLIIDSASVRCVPL